MNSSADHKTVLRDEQPMIKSSQTSMNRRKALASLAAPVGILAASSVSQTTAAESCIEEQSKPAFRYCLNTGTIRGQQVDLKTTVELVAEAGYDGIEPWIREIEKYQQEGGSLTDLKKQISDLGLTVESAIGFSQWIVDDDQKRTQALEQAKREMDILHQIGGNRIAAPPAGATNQEGLNLFAAAERYRQLIQAGESIGVQPQLEVWGFSKNLSRLGEAVFVAVESAHPKACLLLDIYHVYKGGSEFEGIQVINGDSMHVFHVNDYPADPPRPTISDADRVYPGDGVAPYAAIMQTLQRIGFQGALSLELFNRDYWKQDVKTVLATGLAKMKQAEHEV